MFCNADDVENHIPLAVKRVEGYLQTRHIRATGVQPIFPKSYLSPFQFNMRKFAIYFLRFIERFDNLRELSYKLSVPDFIDIGSDSNLCLIKTVNALGHVNLLLEAKPEAKCILTVRYPCGYVASRMRQDKFSEKQSVIGKGLPRAEQARRRGLTLESIEAMSPLERLAWVWTVFNEKAMEDVAGNPNVYLLRYEDLCQSPVQIARELIAFLELDWHPQVEAFLSNSTSSSQDKGGYSIVRNTRREIGKWKRELEQDQIQTIFDIVSDSLPGNLFRDSW